MEEETVENTRGNLQVLMMTTNQGTWARASKLIPEEADTDGENCDGCP